jgi:hypothetical protein
MSVEQTTQLIQLVLNSVLLSVASALVLVGVSSRLASLAQSQATIHTQIAENDARPSDLHSEVFWHQSIHLRKQLRRLQLRAQISQYSLLAGYYGLLVALLSCLGLALRALFNWPLLIPVALLVFVVGVALVLIAITLTLVELHLSDRPFLQEVSPGLLSSSRGMIAPLGATPRPLGKSKRTQKRDAGHPSHASYSRFGRSRLGDRNHRSNAGISG